MSDDFKGHRSKSEMRRVEIMKEADKREPECICGEARKEIELLRQAARPLVNERLIEMTKERDALQTQLQAAREELCERERSNDVLRIDNKELRQRAEAAEARVRELVICPACGESFDRDQACGVSDLLASPEIKGLVEAARKSQTLWSININDKTTYPLAEALAAFHARFGGGK